MPYHSPTINITHKKFAIVDSSIIDGWVSFVPSYLKNIEGSLLLNTLEGLFVIPSNKSNKLFYYSSKNNIINEYGKVIRLTGHHRYAW